MTMQEPVREVRRRGRRDEGVSLVLVAFLMVGICALAALVIDLGNARQVRREAQASTDAAALAGAQDLPSASSTNVTAKQTKARDRAMDYMVKDLFGSSTTVPTCVTAPTCTATVNAATIEIKTPVDPSNPTSTLNAAAGNYSSFYPYIYVKVCRSTPTFFASVLRNSSPNICRSSVARYSIVGGGRDYGLVATDPTKCAALSFAGNSETILTSNGSVMVNSNCTSTSPAGALDSSGSSWQLRFLDGTTEVPGYIGVVGTATLAPCDPVTQTTNCTQTVPTTGISPFGDPLSGLIAPTKPGGTVKSCPQNGGGALTPGAFLDCKITNGNITMEPGVYWFDGGFEMNGGDLVCADGGGKTCTGNGILIYINTGALKLNGNGKVYLPPYKMTCTGASYTGTCWNGLSVWQKDTPEASINGTNDFNLGTVYVANANLKTNGNGGGAAVNITGLVVGKTVEISGTFDFNIKVSTEAPDPPKAPDLGLEK